MIFRTKFAVKPVQSGADLRPILKPFMVDITRGALLFRLHSRGAGLDESPDCYKRLPEVLAEHGDSIRILHTLTPVGVAMAGANEFDPYKD